MTTIEPIREISPESLASLGIDQIAYVRPVAAAGAVAYQVFAADGTPLLMAPSLEIAEATIRHNDMVPVPVH